MIVSQLLNETMQYFLDRGAEAAQAHIEGACSDRIVPPDPELYETRFRLAAICGKTQLALRLMREAIFEKDIWFLPETFQIGSMEALAGNEDFEACRTRSQELLKAARDSSHTLCSWSRMTGSRIMLALHGERQTMADAEEHWAFVRGLDWQVECVQSRELQAPGKFRWEPDGSGPYQLESVCSNIGWYDYEERALAGFGTGCNTILRAIASGILECELVVLHAPLLTVLDTAADSLYKNLMSAGTRLVLTCGTADGEALECAQSLDQGCKDRGIELDYVELEGLGHQFPENFTDIVAKFI